MARAEGRANDPRGHGRCRAALPGEIPARSVLGSWLAGWSFDLAGSYRVAFTLSIFFYACGSVAFWLLRRPAEERGRH
jgi:hypothetical protein